MMLKETMELLQPVQIPWWRFRHLLGGVTLTAHHRKHVGLLLGKKKSWVEMFTAILPSHAKLTLS